MKHSKTISHNALQNLHNKNNGNKSISLRVVLLKKIKPIYCEVKPDDNYFILSFLVPISIKIPSCLGLKKLLAVFLRFIYFESGKQFFTYQNIADILGYNSRQDVENFFAIFKERGSDLVAFMTRKVEYSSYVEPIQKLIEKNPFLSVHELYLKFRKIKVISEECFKKYLSQVNTCTILKTIHSQIDKKEAGWDKGKLISYLAKHIDDQVVKKKIENINSANTEKVSKISSTKMNLSTMNKCFLVMFLVGSGMSYEQISFLFGFSKSYINKLVYKIPSIVQLLLSSIVRYSGIVCIDEKYVKLNGKFHFIFTIVDAVTGVPLLSQYFAEKTTESWQAFFTVFKLHYGKPDLIVSDGCLALAGGRKLVFPNVPFQYCKFHKIRNMLKKIYTNEKDHAKITMYTNKLKQIFSRKTVDARKKALNEMQKLLNGEPKIYFEKRIFNQWKNLCKSMTSNAAERYNRKIKRIVSCKYGLKSPETIQMLSACLWFHDLIMRGQPHLAKESTIANLNISKICQELLNKDHIERLFVQGKQKKAG
jgi:transposase-like protein